MIYPIVYPSAGNTARETTNKENRKMKTQAQMFYDAQNKSFRDNEAFLMLCHPEKYGMQGADPLTLEEFNCMAAKRPDAYERFRTYAEKNLGTV